MSTLLRLLFYLYYSIYNVDIVILIKLKLKVGEVKDSAKKSGLAPFSRQDGSTCPSSLIQHHLHQEGCIHSDRGGGLETEQKLTHPSHSSGPQEASYVLAATAVIRRLVTNSTQWHVEETHKSQ